MASARYKLFSSRRGVPSLPSEGPSSTSATRAFSVGRLPSVEVRHRELDVSRARVPFYESLRRAVCFTEALPKAYREFQQLLERVPLRQRSERASRDIEKADRCVPVRENRGDRSGLLAERTDEVHDISFWYSSEEESIVSVSSLREQTTYAI